MNRIDGESETFVTCEISDTLTVGANQTTGFIGDIVAFSCKDHGADAGEIAPTLRAMEFDGSHANGGGQVAVAIHENQRHEISLNDTVGSLKCNGGKPGQGYPCVAYPILEAGARTGKSTDDPRAGIGIGEPDDPMFTLQSGKQHAVGFQEPYTLAIRGRGDSYNLEYRQDGTANALMTPNGGRGGVGVGAVAAFSGSEFPQGYRIQDDQGISETLSANPAGGMKISPILTNMAVRRLTPVECERLQGFPNNFTAISFRHKPAADGNRYRALGNSMAVNVMRWILERIADVDIR